jgi:hypothetical protein
MRIRKKLLGTDTLVLDFISRLSEKSFPPKICQIMESLLMASLETDTGNPLGDFR